MPRELRQFQETDYWVGNDGAIWSFKRPVPVRMKTEPHYRTCHPRCRIYINGRHQTWFVHAMVAMCYLGPRPVGLLIRHLDGDPTNPRPENLAYGDRHENAEDLLRHRAQRISQGQRERELLLQGRQPGDETGEDLDIAPF